MEGDRAPDDSLEAREPTLEDLRDLCGALHARGARYVVIGGFAIRAAGYNRRTDRLDTALDGAIIRADIGSTALIGAVCGERRGARV